MATAGANENSAEDTTITLQHARQWVSAFNCLVIVVHHTNASGARERGHSSLRGGVDTMISLTPVDDVVVIECTKQRNGAPFEPFTLKLVPVPETGGCVLRMAYVLHGRGRPRRTGCASARTCQNARSRRGCPCHS